MWRAGEIVGLLMLAVFVFGIRVAQIFDPQFNATWFLESHPPWRWERTPLQALPWLPRTEHIGIRIGAALGAALLLWVLLRLLRRLVQAHQVVSVRILLSRDDAAMPLTVGATFDAWAQTVENRYAGWLMGNDPVALDLVRDTEGRLLLFLRGTVRTVGAIEARLRATWTNIRTERQEVPFVEGAFAASVTPRYRNTVTRGFRSYRDYSHSVTESILAVLDEAGGPAHLQFVLSPRSPRFNARAEKEQKAFEDRARARGAIDPSQAGLGMGETAQLQAVVKNAGRQWWRTEVRLVAPSVATGQAVVGALNEAASENAWAYHRVWFGPVRRAWEAWRRVGMPGVWPIVGCTSLPGVFLATVWQLPSARLRVAGLLREPTRRGPALLSIATAGKGDAGVVPVRDEAGRDILLPAPDLVANALAVGAHGTGKSTVLRRFLAFAAERSEWCGILIDPKGSLAEAARGLVPEDRKVVCWRVAEPNGTWGYNPFLAADPARWDVATDRILGAMKQVWRDGSILARSEDYLRHTIAATILLGQQARGFGFTQHLLTHPEEWAMRGDQLAEPVVRQWFLTQAKAYETNAKMVTEATAAPVNKLSALVFGARRAAATCSPVGLDLSRLVADRGILIANLAADEVGEDNAALIAVLLLAGLWDALRENRGTQTLFVIDEAHRILGDTFFHLLAEGREFGARTALGLQFVGQIQDEAARNTVRELVQHLFLFRTQNIAEAQEHSQLIARIYANMISPDEELQDVMSFTPDDLVNLPNYRCVTRLLVGGRPQQAFLAETIRTEPDREGRPWGTCPPEWLTHVPEPPPMELSAPTVEDVDAAEEMAAEEPSMPKARPLKRAPMAGARENRQEDPGEAGLSWAEVARLRERFGIQAADAALAALAGRATPPKNPLGYVYAVARKRCGESKGVD